MAHRTTNKGRRLQQRLQERIKDECERPARDESAHKTKGELSDGDDGIDCEEDELIEDVED